MYFRSQSESYKVCHQFRLMKQDDYFGSNLTTFESSIISGGSWGSIENRLESKTEPPPSGNLACTNPLNASYSVA